MNDEKITVRVTENGNTLKVIVLDKRNKKIQLIHRTGINNEQ
jgi:hypothetical protein